jgi:hypothetical protein
VSGKKWNHIADVEDSRLAAAAVDLLEQYRELAASANPPDSVRKE